MSATEPTTRPELLAEVARQVDEYEIGESDAIENIADMLGRSFLEVSDATAAVLCPDDANVWDYLAETERIGGVR